MSSSGPYVCKQCREEMPDINWTHPCPHWKLVPELVEIARQQEEIDSLRQQLAAFNTAWQHDPPEVGDTRWVRVRFAGVAAPVTYEWLDEEPAE